MENRNETRTFNENCVNYNDPTAYLGIEGENEGK